MDHQNVLAAQTRPVRGAPGVGMNGTVAGEMKYSAYICMYMYIHACTYTLSTVQYYHRMIIECKITYMYLTARPYILYMVT